MKAAVRSRYGPPEVLTVQDVTTPVPKDDDVYVTAVCAGEHRHLMLSLGADKVVDYRTQDFTRDTERYDLIVDAVGKTSYVACRKLMQNDGVYTYSGSSNNTADV